MAEARTRLTPQQKIEMARKASADANRGEVNPDVGDDRAGGLKKIQGG
jgi:hypothetical protein